MAQAPLTPESLRTAFSIPEVCKQVGLCRDTVYRAIGRGDLVARKLGKRTLILAADLDRFLNSLPLKRSEAA
jgi:excisionase family DNA binding protein